MRTLLGVIPVIAAALCCSSHGPEPAPAVRRAAAPATCGSQCGTERWLVKTFADPDRDQVDLNAHRTSVATLAALARPGLLPDAGRALPRRSARPLLCKLTWLVGAPKPTVIYTSSSLIPTSREWPWSPRSQIPAAVERARRASRRHLRERGPRWKLSYHDPIRRTARSASRSLASASLIGTTGNLELLPTLSSFIRC